MENYHIIKRQHKKGEKNMIKTEAKVILENGDIERFVADIAAYANAGKNVEIHLLGYKAVVYAYSAKDSIRMSVLNKLRTIRNYERNLQTVITYADLGPDEMARVKTLKPDALADLCLELGLSGSYEDVTAKKMA